LGGSSPLTMCNLDDTVDGVFDNDDALDGAGDEDDDADWTAIRRVVPVSIIFQITGMIAKNKVRDMTCSAAISWYDPFGICT
jgi:hypothetical protein